MIHAVQFDPHTGVLVDEQGLMLPKEAVLALARQCLDHLKHSELELQALGRQYVEKNHPRMVEQFNFDIYP